MERDTTADAGSGPPTPHLTSPLEGGRDELEKVCEGWALLVERGVVAGG